MTEIPNQKEASQMGAAEIEGVVSEITFTDLMDRKTGDVTATKRKHVMKLDGIQKVADVRPPGGKEGSSQALSAARGVARPCHSGSEAVRRPEREPERPPEAYVGLALAEIRAVQEGLHFIGPLPAYLRPLEEKLKLAAAAAGEGE